MAHDRNIKLSAILAFAVLGGPPAYTCGWWDCSDGYGYRNPARVYGYSKQVRSKARVRALSREDLIGAAPPPQGDSGLLPIGFLSASGIMGSALPGPGPSLFGSAPSYHRTPSVRGWQRRYQGRSQRFR